MLPVAWTQRVVTRLVARAQSRLAPAEALRFLLELDGQLYRLTSMRAVAYGKGTHPKHRLTNYHEFFVGRIQKGERVLEIGCGNGALAFDLAERSGANVVGIDFNKETVAEARRRFPHARIDYQVGDALGEFPEGRFDVVVLSNVLEHLPDRTEFLRRVIERIGPRRLLIRVPLFERDWRVPLKKELGVEWRLDRTHETEYTLEGFKEEMAAAGLETVHVEIRWGEIWAEVHPL